MKSLWFKGVAETDKDKVKKEIQQAKPCLDRLSAILDIRIEDSITEMSRKVHLKEAGNLQEMTAYQLGEQEALRKVITLLNIEER